MNVDVDIRKLARACRLDVDGAEYDLAVDVRVLDNDPQLARHVWEDYGAVSAYPADSLGYAIVTVREMLAQVGVDVAPQEGWSESGAGRWSATLERRREARACIDRLIRNRETARLVEAWRAER